MCGRFEAYGNWREMQEAVRYFEPLPFPSGEIRPTDQYPIINASGQLAMARWWLVPRWYKGPVKDWKASTFNAKIEEASTKASFRESWVDRACIIPVSALYEWVGEKSPKQKYQIKRADNHPLAFAGLWDVAQCEDGEVISFTILSRAAGPDMQPIHNREPVIVHPDHWNDWLEFGVTPDLKKPAAAGTLRLSPVD